MLLHRDTILEILKVHSHEFLPGVDIVLLMIMFVVDRESNWGNSPCQSRGNILPRLGGHSEYIIYEAWFSPWPVHKLPFYFLAHNFCWWRRWCCCQLEFWYRLIELSFPGTLQMILSIFLNLVHRGGSIIPKRFLWLYWLLHWPHSGSGSQLLWWWGLLRHTWNWKGYFSYS